MPNPPPRPAGSSVVGHPEVATDRALGGMARLLVPSSAVLWGLHSSLLSPALALLLATLFDASTAQIGWSLAIYNVGGFVASLVIPAWTDRRHTYLAALVACGLFTIALALCLALAGSLALATAALVLFGAPAGVGTTMLFAHLRHRGASTSSIVNTRAIISVAWMGGPPLATAIIGWFGARGLLLALVVIAVFNIVTALACARPTAMAGSRPTRSRPPPGCGCRRGGDG